MFFAQPDTAEASAAPTFTDAQVASYLQSQNVSSPDQIAAVSNAFGVNADQISRAQDLISQNDPGIAAATNAYNASVAGRPDLVAQNYDFGVSNGLINSSLPNTGLQNTASQGAALPTAALPTFSDAAVASYLQSHNATTPDQISSIASTFGVNADQMSRAQQLINQKDPSIAAATQNWYKTADPQNQISAAYNHILNRNPDAEGLMYWTEKLNAGMPISDIQTAIRASNENIARVSSGQFTDLEVAAYIRDNNLSGQGITNAMGAFGITPIQLQKAQALLSSNDPSIAEATAAYNASIAKNPSLVADNLKLYNPATGTGSIAGSSTTIKSLLSATLGSSLVNSMTPDQLSAYTRSYNTSSANENDRLLDIYKQVATDPTLGTKLKTENPYLYEAVTPLQRTTGAFNGGVSGIYGTYKVNGVDVPILSAKATEDLLQGTQTRQSFSATDVGWAGGGASGKITKGADALGVTVLRDEDGNVYGIDGLTQAADLLKISPTQFKDKYENVLSKEQRNEDGDVVVKAGQPVYKGDGEGGFLRDANGNYIPETRTVTAQQQLYDAVNAASQDLYSFTGANLNQGLYNEGTKGNQSFQTTLYQKAGDKLIPISTPQAHGGVVAASDLGGGSGFSFKNDIQPGLVFVGLTALGWMAGDPSLGFSTTIGSAIVPAGTSAATTTLVGSVAIGAAIGATSAAVSGGDPLKGAATGGITAGVQQGMAPLLNEIPTSTWDSLS